jgi:hypothetical protein
MKKITMLLGVLSIMAVASCKQKEETTEKTAEPIIEVTTDAPPAKVNPDGTTISIGTDGVDVSTKNGENQTKVSVSDGAAKVEVKK